jgi:molecular chaperone DnaK (HSP70)
MSGLKLNFLIGVWGLFMMLSCFSAAYGQDEKPTLKYPIGIDTSDGFSEMIAASKPLPLVYSESFSNYRDNQKTVQIALSQKTPEGMEKIIVIDVEIPPQPKATVHVLVTLKIDKYKNLTVKSSVTETGAVKTFGPVPVE